MKIHLFAGLGLFSVVAWSGSALTAQTCVNAPGKSCPDGIGLSGPVELPQPLTQTKTACSMPGAWTDSGGAKITVNANLTGTFAAPYCPQAHSLAITPQGTNQYRVRLIWSGARGVCQSATINLAFTTADCSRAQGPYVNDDGTSGVDVWIRSGLQITLSRPKLMAISAKGTPSGGTFSYSAAKVGGSNIAGIKMAPGVAATDNPNTANLTNPANPNGSGAPAPGGLAEITATYTAKNNEKVSKKFSAPAFGLSCYYTASEEDWGTPPNDCKPYAGTISDPHGFPGTYCKSFIAQLERQGSAYLRDGRIVQYDPAKKKISVVQEIRGADNTPVVAGKTLARDRTIIPRGGVLVDIDRVGAGLTANDTGGAIKGYRIDLYKGSGKKACARFANIISVAACTPGNSKCPASNLP